MGMSLGTILFTLKDAQSFNRHGKRNGQRLSTRPIRRQINRHERRQGKRLIAEQVDYSPVPAPFWTERDDWDDDLECHVCNGPCRAV